jgi:tetratricopeptide (TPR) repeat protein
MELCRNAIAAIRQSGDRPALALHLVEYSTVQLTCAEYRQAYRSAVEGLEIFLEVDRENLNLGPIYFMSRSVIPLSLLFAGEWGEALRELDASIAMTEKNGHPYRRRLYCLYLALVHIEAMDFEGALAICAEVMGSIESDSNPSRRQHTIICLTIRGMAEMGLGNYDRAFEYLTTSSEDMDREMIMRGWYWQLIILWGLTGIWLARGDQSKARREAERLLKAALSTAERTWQALAWEASARVAMAEVDLTRAKERIAKALSAMEGFEVPIAHWRVHATASELYARLGEADSAEKHRHLSRATIMTLADSLPIEGPLRDIFLSASMIRKALGKNAEHESLYATEG